MAETTEANLVSNISKEDKEIKIVFWNVAGLRKKCENEQFLEYIKKFDIIGMVETWIEEKDWNNMKELLPKEFRWRCQYIGKKKKRGRSIGGIITGVTIEITEETEEPETLQRKQKKSEYK